MTWTSLKTVHKWSSTRARSDQDPDRFWAWRMMSVYKDWQDCQVGRRVKTCPETCIVIWQYCQKRTWYKWPGWSEVDQEWSGYLLTGQILYKDPRYTGILGLVEAKTYRVLRLYRRTADSERYAVVAIWEGHFLDSRRSKTWFSGLWPSRS